MVRILLILLMMALAATPAAAAPGPGQVGAEAADWTLEAFGGGSYTLGDYRDKAVLFLVAGWG